MSATTAASAYAPFAQELRRLLPESAAVLDAHTHLGADEDGQSLAPEQLVGFLDDIGPGARACAFPFHDPERRPSYRRPNDRVLDWAAASDGRIIPYCRLDPADEPVAEARRCLARGARGIKLHPRAQGFGFDGPQIEVIFGVAAEAGVPILVHAGRGMPPMDALADVALRHPEVALVLAHAGTAGQGMFAKRLVEHPVVLYDTSCLSPFDVVALFTRVAAERIVFASDVPYGRPASGLFQAMRVAALAGLDGDDRARVAGATMAAVLEGRRPARARAPRLAQARAVDARLLRVGAHMMLAFGALLAGGGQRDLDVGAMVGPIAMARSVCRDPDPGAAGAALERIDAALAAAQQLIAAPRGDARAAIGLVHGVAVIAATEPA